jgi:XTP/dITP diphosphohydrolase
MSDVLSPLGIQIVSASQWVDVSTIAESGTSLVENAAIKASTVARLTEHWSLGDDTGLFVEALGGAPGIYSARYAGPGASAANNREKLLAQMAHIPSERRGAYFECALSLADPGGNLCIALTACCRGIILTEPRGNFGFGYDSIFLIREYRRTLAELSPTTKSVLSHRGRAAQRLAPQVVRLLG